jgi:hypothetical protein
MRFDRLSISPGTSQLDGLLVLELSPSPIRGAETELVTIQFEFDMWAIQHSGSCFSRNIIIITTTTTTAACP